MLTQTITVNYFTGHKFIFLTETKIRRSLIVANFVTYVGYNYNFTKKLFVRKCLFHRIILSYFRVTTVCCQY